jgi:delta-aminolevulinic acid dehydratase/porphobilinogen synthase
MRHVCTSLLQAIFFTHDTSYFSSYRDFILPLFIHESDAMEEISSMPGCFRHSVASMLAEVEEAMRYVRTCELSGIR